MNTHIHVHLQGRRVGRTKDVSSTEIDKQIAYVKSKMEQADNELSRGRLDPGQHLKEMASLEKEMKRLQALKKTATKDAFINGRDLASKGYILSSHAQHMRVGELHDFYAPPSGDKIQGKVTKVGAEVVLQVGAKRYTLKVVNEVQAKKILGEP